MSRANHKLWVLACCADKTLLLGQTHNDLFCFADHFSVIVDLKVIFSRIVNGVISCSCYKTQLLRTQ